MRKELETILQRIYKLALKRTEESQFPITAFAINIDKVILKKEDYKYLIILNAMGFTRFAGTTNDCCAVTHSGITYLNLK